MDEIINRILDGYDAGKGEGYISGSYDDECVIILVGPFMLELYQSYSCMITCIVKKRFFYISYIRQGSVREPFAANEKTPLGKRLNDTYQGLIYEREEAAAFKQAQRETQIKKDLDKLLKDNKL